MSELTMLEKMAEEGTLTPGHILISDWLAEHNARLLERLAKDAPASWMFPNRAGPRSPIARFLTEEAAEIRARQGILNELVGNATSPDARVGEEDA